MTDQELKELVASLAIAQKETDRQLKETDRQLKETSREMKEKTAETDRQLNEKFAETERQMKEKTAETDRELKETSRELKETSRLVKELSKNIGGLNNKFGSFTEALAFPSMSKIMEERFGMETFTTRLRRKKAGEHAEVDAIAYTNGGRNELYVIEVKSILDKREVKQVLKILKDFRTFFPEFADKTLKGVVAYIDARASAKQEVLKSGLYLACIHEGLFSLETPDDFTPRAF